MSKCHKISKELCLSCKYKTYFPASGIFDIRWPSTAACGYLLYTGESRVFRDERYRKDYKPGYCQVYERKEKGVKE